MHEALFDDQFLDGTGVSTLDYAKALIDEGYHPMTMYFPLVVHGAMLIEPTEVRNPKQVARPLHPCTSDDGAGSQGRSDRALRRRAALGPAPPPR